MPGRKHNTPMINETRLARLINTTHESRKGLTKSQNNLPAKLLSLESPQSYNPEGHNIQVHSQVHSQGNIQNHSYSKSSVVSSVMKDGEIHTEGKEVINDSNKPYLDVKEMHDGRLEHFKIPKNSIPYKNKNLNKYLEVLSRKDKLKTKKTKKIKKTKKTKSGKSRKH